jgi:glyoxylase-like metal-dependent hydrolase (beta-lactamase superfamily II)
MQEAVMFWPSNIWDDSGPTATRRLILLDGGPINKTHQPPTDRHSDAPYYKYLFSAYKQIWQQIRRNVLPPATVPIFQPDAIFISRSHDDHYGGILQLLTGSLPTTYRATAQPGDKMFFNGPFIFPRNGDTDDSTGYTALKPGLNSLPFWSKLGLSERVVC